MPGSDGAWFEEAVRLAAREQVFQWHEAERDLTRRCSAQPALDVLREFLAYFQVARTVPSVERANFLAFVSRATIDARDFRSTAAALLGYQAGAGGRRPLSALSKWVLVTNPGSPWTPFDRYACAALGIENPSTAERFSSFYERLASSDWTRVCEALDARIVATHGHSIARVFDKFLFLAGAEALGTPEWETFLENAGRLEPEQRAEADALANAVLGSPEAGALLKNLLCERARAALRDAYQRPR